MKRSKRYIQSAKQITDKEYSLNEGVKLLKKTANAKFDETIEMAIRLGVDPSRCLR